MQLTDLMELMTLLTRLVPQLVSGGLVVGILIDFGLGLCSLLHVCVAYLINQK